MEPSFGLSNLGATLSEAESELAPPPPPKDVCFLRGGRAGLLTMGPRGA